MNNWWKKGRVVLTAVLALVLAGCGAGNSANTSEATSAESAQTSEAAISVAASTETSEKAGETKEAVELTVFAAASLTNVMHDVEAKYTEANPNVTFVNTFDSSGTLRTQIQEGADADVFISAAEKTMNDIDPEKKEGLTGGTVDSATRVQLLKNEVVLAVAPGSELGITAFEDFNTDKVSKIALGNSDVPVGIYSEELLKNLGIWDAIQPKVTFASNVREVRSWVAEGAADAGIMYSTDAKQANLEVVAKAGAELKTPVIYPAALVTSTTKRDAAAAFLEYLQGDAAFALFEEAGFAKP